MDKGMREVPFARANPRDSSSVKPGKVFRTLYA